MKRTGKKKGRRVPQSATQREAGIANLAKFRRPGQNLNHGLNVVLRSKGEELPDSPGAGKIAEQVDSLIDEMVTDLGHSSRSEVPAQKRAILEAQRLALLVLGLSNDYLRREGLVNRRGKPHPLLSIVVSFSNTLRLNGVALGLERRPKNARADTLEGVIAEYHEKSEKEPPSESQDSNA